MSLPFFNNLSMLPSRLYEFSPILNRANLYYVGTQVLVMENTPSFLVKTTPGRSGNVSPSSNRPPTAFISSLITTLLVSFSTPSLYLKGSQNLILVSLHRWIVLFSNGLKFLSTTPTWNFNPSPLFQPQWILSFLTFSSHRGTLKSWFRRERLTRGYQGKAGEAF